MTAARHHDADEDLAGAGNAASGPFAQDSCDALAEQPRTIDADALPGEAAATAAHGVGHVEQHLGVGPRIAGAAHRRVVGCELGGEGQPPFEPPREGMKPEETAVEVGQHGGERVAPADMREFMREHGAEFVSRPVAPAQREDHLRRDRSDGDRDGHLRRLENGGVQAVGLGALSRNAVHCEPAGRKAGKEKQDSGCPEDCQPLGRRRGNPVGGRVRRRGIRGSRGGNVRLQFRNLDHGRIIAAERRHGDGRRKPGDNKGKHRHEQHGAQYGAPHGVSRGTATDARKAQRQTRQSGDGDDAERRFQEDPEQGIHLRFPTFLAMRSSCSAERTFSSTMPTTNSSADPAQKRSINWRTMRAARLWEGALAR